MSDELAALEQAATGLYKGIARLRAQRGTERDLKMERLTRRVESVEDKIAALGLAQDTYATEQSVDEAFDAAIQANRTVTFKYEDANGAITTRTVSPYRTDNGLVLGYDHVREALRRFYPDRVTILAVGAEDYIDPT